LGIFLYSFIHVLRVRGANRIERFFVSIHLFFKRGFHFECAAAMLTAVAAYFAIRAPYAAAEAGGRFASAVRFVAAQTRLGEVF
jgi:hypothetical protein